MEKVIQELMSGSLIDSDVTSITWKMIGLAEILCVIFFLINLAYNFASTTIRNLGKGTGIFRMEELIRTLVIMLLISLYIPVFGWVASMSNYINSYTVPNKEIIENRINFSKKNSETLFPTSGENSESNSSEYDTSSKTTETSIWDIFSNFTLGGILSNSINSITILLLAIIRLVIQSFAILLSRFFFILGPLAIAFSILPNQKDKIGKWFNVYLNVLFIGTTCNIIDTIAYSNFVSGLVSSDYNEIIYSTAFNSVIIVLYLLSYWLTSFYVGSSDAGKVLSTAVTAASTLASAGISGAAAAGAGASGSISNAASVGKNIIEKN